jgi:hypothetical protein
MWNHVEKCGDVNVYFQHDYILSTLFWMGCWSINQLTIGCCRLSKGHDVIDLLHGHSGLITSRSH